ncbi:TNFAIP3-interacting protein 2 isoform X2 [Brachionichthys hirsutus]|uniref:TNFAIP3-interacting protein 2 isoform X2 n=1 Tax=Brachionichthys hirsutus TaxID=412623 RepID=UPI0036050F21
MDPRVKSTEPEMERAKAEGKNRSYSTLNSLYHEARQEMELLNKQSFVKDNIIAELKARLGRYERIYLTVGDGEAVAVGPAKSLLESLCKEICKLKQKRNDMEFKTSRRAEEIQRLNVQLGEKELELERVRGQPDHEKDREIQRLMSALEEKGRSEATRAVLCSSLAEEAEQLRGQLGATVKVCQELLVRLEKGQPGGGEGMDVVARQDDAEEGSGSSGVGAVSAQTHRLQEENRQLKRRVGYVQGLNSQWQKYDSSREDYIRGLCQRLKEASGPGLMPGLGAASAGLLHHEISRLNGLLLEKMDECERLDGEAEDARRRGQERVQTLEQQVLIYTEDFKSERADRERAQGQMEDLKEQVHQLKRQLHKQGASRENREAVPLCRVHIGHQISARRHKESSEPLLRATADLQQKPASSSAAAAAAPNPAWNETPGLSELQCPRCLATFNDRDAIEYLNHCEECAKL